MGFKGTLDSINLADIFQNLAMNQQTGTLRVQNRNEFKCIYFDRGGIRYLSLPASTSSHRFITEALAKEGVVLHATAEVDDFDTASVFVELGLGHAIVPAVQGRSFARGGRLRAIPIQGLPPLPVGWAARNFQLLPPAAVEFMEIVADTVHQWSGVPGVRIITGRGAR